MDISMLKTLLRDLEENFNELYGYIVETVGEENEEIETYGSRFDIAMDSIRGMIEEERRKTNEK